MPFGDGTGPRGRGPMTGRGGGFRAGGGGFGAGGGGLRGGGGGGICGWRNWFRSTGPANPQTGWENRSQPLEDALAEIRSRLAALEAKPKQE